MPTGPHTQVNGDLLLLKWKAGRRDLGRTYNLIPGASWTGPRKGTYFDEGSIEGGYAAHSDQRGEKASEIEDYEPRHWFGF